MTAFRVMLVTGEAVTFESKDFNTAEDLGAYLATVGRVSGGTPRTQGQPGSLTKLMTPTVIFARAVAMIIETAENLRD